MFAVTWWSLAPPGSALILVAANWSRHRVVVNILRQPRRSRCKVDAGKTRGIERQGEVKQEIDGERKGCRGGEKIVNKK